MDLSLRLREDWILGSQVLRMPLAHLIKVRYYHYWASLVAQMVKNSPAVQETQEVWVQSQGGEDLLEKEMATHSSILAWEIPWTEEPGGLQSMQSQRVGHNSVTKQQQQYHIFVFVCLSYFTQYDNI